MLWKTVNMKVLGIIVPDTPASCLSQSHSLYHSSKWVVMTALSIPPSINVSRAIVHVAYPEIVKIAAAPSRE